MNIEDRLQRIEQTMQVLIETKQMQTQVDILLARGDTDGADRVLRKSLYRTDSEYIQDEVRPRNSKPLFHTPKSIEF